MTDARRLIKVMQEAGKTPDSDLADVVLGIVESVDPLIVSLDKLRLTSTFITKSEDIVINAIGDRLRMLRCGKGQKYIVLENLDYSFASQFRLFRSVKSYGCAGDGQKDDTEAFQRAINDAVSTGNMLYVDVGTYLITNRLVIPSPLTILGVNHTSSIIKFSGTYHTETKYDENYWEEANAAILVRANNCRIENLSIVGGTSKYDASACNGIIYHYPSEEYNRYRSAERCTLHNVDIKYFKNGVFSYAGWNRLYTNCQFIDNSDSGIKWYPLDPVLVGNWSGSGDSILSCQFIGNAVAGMSVYGLYDSSFFDLKCEYNGRALIINKCNDVTFFNCWNEANYNLISVTGCARFQGGYNINPSTVTHIKDNVDDIVVFEGKASTIIVSGTEIKFSQLSGIITKGVSIASEIINLMQNPYFDDNGNPSMAGWDLYIPSATNADNTVLYEGHNSAHFLVSEHGESYFGFRQTILVELGKQYKISFRAMSPDRSTIDGQGLCVYISHRNPAGEVSWNDNRFFTLLSDNVWEQQSFTFTPSGDDASIIIGFGCFQNGNVYFATPVMVDADSLGDNSVFTRIKDTDTFSFVDAMGVEVGTAPRNPNTKQNVDISNMQASTVEEELLYLETSLLSKVNNSDIGVNNGVAQLDTSGHVPASQLPSFVNDVVEYSTLLSFPSTGEAGIIYVTLDSNKTYRWTGSNYVEISKSLAIGETSDSAFAGDRGKAIETALSNLILDKIYRIGDYKWTSDSVNPSTYIGGTWVQIKDRFMLAAGDTYSPGATGGAASVAISQANLPAISYEVIANGSMGGTNHRIYGDYGGGAGSIYTSHLMQEGPYAVAVNPATVGPLGSGTAHDNMPPYIVAYCWKRTA